MDAVPREGEKEGLPARSEMDVVATGLFKSVLSRPTYVVKRFRADPARRNSPSGYQSPDKATTVKMVSDCP